MPLFPFNPIAYLKNNRKFSLISIAPILLILNSFFEILSLILLFTNDSLSNQEFIVYMIFASIILLVTLVIFRYLQNKMENLYPFHSVFLSFMLVFLFSGNQNVSAILQVSEIMYFLGFLSASFQIITILKSSILIGLASTLLTNLLYFFYFVKNCQLILVFVYYFLLCLYLVLFRLDTEVNTAEEAEETDSVELEDIKNEVLIKVMKEMTPGNFFILTYDHKNTKEIDKGSLKETALDSFQINIPEASPLKRLDQYSRLIYRNQGCLDYGLESKKDFFTFLENFEIGTVAPKETKTKEKFTKIDISKLSTQRPFFNNHLESPNKDLLADLEEKDSDFMRQENNKRNLLLLLKNRLDFSELSSEKEEILTITGHVETRKGRKPIRLTFSQFLVKSHGFIFFHFFELSPDEDVVNMKEISRLKDQMLANVAHDLRSPISGILAFIDQSLDPNLSQMEREKLLDFAKINANLLLHLVGDILDFSQLKKGCLNLVIKSFSLKEIVNQLFSFMRYQAELKHIKLLLDYQPTQDIKLHSDDKRLCQLLINLLTNAIKFTVKGFVVLRISQTRYHNLLKFEVIDTGIGIKSEIKPKLFKPFSTFSDECLHNKYGIGLGLNICKTIVSLLGPCDEIHLASDYGKGSKFGFLLFTKLKKLENSSLRFNKSKVIWDKSDFRIKKKPILEYVNPKSNDTDEEINTPLKPGENKHTLDLSEKVDVSSFFSDNLEFHIPEFEEHWEFHKEIMEKSKIEAEINSENKRESMKKVFSLNNLAESKIKLTENSLNILIVDDNPFNIFILKNYLKKFNSNGNKNNNANIVFNVFSAANGTQAYEIFEEYNNPLNLDKNRPIHLIFMDCQMPIMSGYQATRNIKEKISSEGYYKALIVAVTAYNNEDACLECGMDAYLLKPVSEKDFLEVFEMFSF